jgi:hypothetical protein
MTVSSPDVLFVPQVSDAEVVRQCRSALRTVVNDARPSIPDVVAHAVVVRRATTVADLDIIDGAVGRFIRTGEVPAESARLIWRPLYGTVFSALPAGQQDQANALAVYLGHHAGRGPVAGWPCA